MFSGKTEELIRRLKRARIANQKVEIFKPSKDTRYDQRKLVSHDENALLSRPVLSAKDLLSVLDETEVIGIDEAQFFDNQIIEVSQTLALKGKRVIVAGLDLDFRGDPFGPMPGIMAVAEYITKVHAICPHCGNLATHSYRLSEEEETIVLGEQDKYEPRCRLCFSMGTIISFK